MEPILQVSNLTKTYFSQERSLTVLNNVSFSIEQGSICSIVGPSGSGKTTLLGLCAGLDRATSGSVRLNGQPLEQMSENERAALRGRQVGFIFQNFQLLPTLTALENVMVPLELQRATQARTKAQDLLARVGLAERWGHYPTQLSGGEQQRVALARAFANQPQILFADEPTGNLDGQTSVLIEQLLFDLNHEQGTTLVVVTHNPELARKTGRIIRLKGGELIEDQQTSTPNP